MLALLLVLTPPALQTDATDLELFERAVRPVLVERCYRCHNSTGRRESGLALDHAQGLLTGGSRGPAIVPGAPDQSLLLRAVRHEQGAPAMPEDEPVLGPDELDSFVRWIAAGAPDPRDRPPSSDSLAEEMSWERTRERRLEWWSFQPVEEQPAPPVAREQWLRDPLDRYVLAAAEAQGRAPAPDVDRATWLRRASFVLTGLPPTQDELSSFLAEEDEGAYARAADRLLASPHFSERMARHWMDLFRYADSHGSEGDPSVPNAFRYRDYLIRAFDADVPWNRLVQEHVAGDLLAPRLDPSTGVNDAEIGLGHLRFVQHGYAPTDPLVDQVQFTDNQIDVLTKATLGLTVACARCHDHKFDPVSQADYYALYGVLVSTVAGVRTVDGEERRGAHVAELRASKPAIRAGLARAWTAALPELPGRLRASEEALQEAREAHAKNRPHALAPWVAALDGEQVLEDWERRTRDVQESRRARAEDLAAAAEHWDLAGADASSWFAHGSILSNEPVAPGEFSVLPEGTRVLESVLPAGIYTHLVSSRHSGVLHSPSFQVPGGTLWIRAMGGGGARARYAMQKHPRVSGPTYHASGLSDTQPRWIRWDMSYWSGDLAHLELATARDIPVEARGDERSYWGVSEARLVPPGAPAPRARWCEVLAPLVDTNRAPRDEPELAARYLATLRGVLWRWSQAESSDADARFLEPFLRHGLLPVELEQLPEVAPLVERYRELEAGVPVPVRAPGVLAGEHVEQPLFERGNHRKPSAPVPQRFLGWLDETPYEGNGRLALARDLVREDNPLAARVAANRLWTWVFGQGLVPSVDNFGRLGQEPTNPALLDHLATRLVEDGWSIKSMLHDLVTSRTFRQQAPARRLDAESVRDALLTVSGRLDRSRFGGPASEGSARRSLYVSQRRTGMPPFLAAFDQPAPNTTVGRRSSTNVPAQALALMNDPIALECSRAFAERTRAGTDDERTTAMFTRALGRPPSDEERARTRLFLEETRASWEQAEAEARERRDQLTLDEQAVGELMSRGRARALAARGEDSAATTSHLPRPIASWEFEGDLRDDVGGLHALQAGQIAFQDGRLILEGQGHVRTPPLRDDLHEKSLEAWVKITDLGQGGSGIVTVQDLGGGVFDSLVYAEREGRRWIAGSDNFRRTQDVGGVEESGELMHMAVTYAADGTITLYRGGELYGTGYPSSGPVHFRAGESMVLIGARHGGTSDPRGAARAEVERARLYDRALSPEELAASAAGSPDFVSQTEILAALTEIERAELESRRARCAVHLARLEALERERGGGPDRAWRELAHALFQLEEFRYLR